MYFEFTPIYYQFLQLNCAIKYSNAFANVSTPITFAESMIFINSCMFSFNSVSELWGINEKFNMGALKF